MNATMKWASPNDISYGVPGRHNGKGYADHGGALNVMFCDFHVEPIHKEDIPFNYPGYPLPPFGAQGVPWIPQ